MELPAQCQLTYDGSSDPRLLALINQVPAELWGAKLALQVSSSLPQLQQVQTFCSTHALEAWQGCRHPAHTVKPGRQCIVASPPAAIASLSQLPESLSAVAPGPDQELPSLLHPWPRSLLFYLAALCALHAMATAS